MIFLREGLVSEGVRSFRGHGKLDRDFFSQKFRKSQVVCKPFTDLDISNFFNSFYFWPKEINLEN